MCTAFMPPFLQHLRHFAPVNAQRYRNLSVAFPPLVSIEYLLQAWVPCVKLAVFVLLLRSWQHERSLCFPVFSRQVFEGFIGIYIRCHFTRYQHSRAENSIIQTCKPLAHLSNGKRNHKQAYAYKARNRYASSHYPYDTHMGE